MTLQHENVLAGPKVPNSPMRIEPPGPGQRTVLVEREAIDGTRVAFLMQDLFLSLKVPQAP